MNPEKFEENLKKMPIVESSMRMSKDGKYFVHKTIITDIKPNAYIEKVLQGSPEELAEAEE